MEDIKIEKVTYDPGLLNAIQTMKTTGKVIAAVLSIVTILFAVGSAALLIKMF